MEGRKEGRKEPVPVKIQGNLEIASKLHLLGRFGTVAHLFHLLSDFRGHARPVILHERLYFMEAGVERCTQRGGASTSDFLEFPCTFIPFRNVPMHKKYAEETFLSNLRQTCLLCNYPQKKNLKFMWWTIPS